MSIRDNCYLPPLPGKAQAVHSFQLNSWWLSEKHSEQGVQHLHSLTPTNQPQGCSAHLCRPSNAILTPVVQGGSWATCLFILKRAALESPFGRYSQTNHCLLHSMAMSSTKRNKTKQNKKTRRTTTATTQTANPTSSSRSNSTGTYLLYLLHLWPLQVSQTDSLAGQAVLKLRQHWTCSMPVNWSQECQKQNSVHWVSPAPRGYSAITTWDSSLGMLPHPVAARWPRGLPGSSLYPLQSTDSTALGPGSDMPLHHRHCVL